MTPQVLEIISYFCIIKYNTIIMTEKYKSPENLQTALDCAIRDFEGKTGGFEMKNKGVSYCNYMTKEEWGNYKESINEHHKKQFDDGAGGELKEGKYPPKMASFGSSSRFIYELSKGIDGFEFEEKLDTRVGGIAHLDGSLKKDSEYIYVEAKKREIYGGSHENEAIKEVYIDVYNHIIECIGEEKFSYVPETSKKIGYKKITFKIGGHNVQYFDLKQLICHFLGITYDIAKHSIRNTKVKFLYLIYNPQEVTDKMTSVYREKIENRYKEVAEFVNDNIKNGVFNAIFQAVLDYQTTKQGLEKKTKIGFEMKLVDPSNYEEEFT